LCRIADEFGFDEDERDIKLGGLVALGFFFVGAPASFLIGWLADSINRSPLFAATVFIGEFGCLLVYFVQTYPQLYACRVLTGISIGGAIPIVFSVLGDLYPANQRAAIAAIVTTGTGLGTGIGQVIAGSLSSWRLPFLVVSVPGMICSMLLLFVRDPKRGANEAAVIELTNEKRNKVESALSQSDTLPVSVARGDRIEKLENCGMDCTMPFDDSDCETLKVLNAWNPEVLSPRGGAPVTAVMPQQPKVQRQKYVSCKSTCELLKIRSVLLIILQAAPGSLPFGFCATFLNDFLQQQRGMTKQEATGILLTFGAGNAIGVIAGGVLGHISYKRDVRGPALIMGTSLILGCIPFYFLINTVTDEVSVGAAVAVMGGILVVIPVPLERSILTNICEPQSRGRANALVSIVDDLGKGLGPALISLLITTFDRQTAFNISLIGWIIGGCLSLAIALFVVKDEQSVQQKLRDKIANNDIEWQLEEPKFR
jgi:MFS family permease